MINKTPNFRSAPDRALRMAILVAALGYFVDVFDLVLFSIFRVESLRAIGVPDEHLLDQGVYLLNCQMLGLLAGGVLWGVWGDKRGRLEVLFGSILLYSLANIANAFVTNVPQYALLRLLAGIGLAGEIGAGITLVSELMPREKRGYGTTIVASVGVSGALGAALVAEMFTWRTAYLIGGVMGLALLALRVSVAESRLFNCCKAAPGVRKGDLRLLLGSWSRLRRYAACILIGSPIWFVVGILVTFSPEIGAALDIEEPLKVGRAVMFYTVGITIGDVASGLLSQYFRSRRAVLGGFLAGAVVLSFQLLTSRGTSAESYYLTLLPLGFCIGYWAVLITTAAEQFGTNLRATVATTVPNFVRGTTVLMTLAFNGLKPVAGVAASAEIVGIFVFAFAAVSVWSLRETFGVDLDFYETPEPPPAKEPTRRLDEEMPLAA